MFVLCLFCIFFCFMFLFCFLFYVCFVFVTYRGLVVAVTHDRYFLDNVAGYILEIDQGRLIPFRGNYAAWLESKAKRIELEEK